MVALVEDFRTFQGLDATFAPFVFYIRGHQLFEYIGGTNYSKPEGIFGRNLETMNLKESDDLYRVTEPGDVLRLMQRLQREGQSVVMTVQGGRKIMTMLLNVDGDLCNFVYDSGRDQQETQAVLSTSRIHFSATLGGVPVSFTTPPPVAVDFDGSPALVSPLPLEMLYLQRREYYRTKGPQLYRCSARLTDGTAISLDLRDLSVTGVGLQSKTIPPDQLPVGTLLGDAVLDFMELGTVEGVTLMVTSQKKVEEKGLATYLYGCRFHQLPKSKDSILQRLTFSLEQLQRAKTRDTNRD
jgi:c-di-GMP-binding flagellar brake protein YcgR